MKKILSLSLALLLVVGMLAACSSPTPEPEPEETDPVVNGEGDENGETSDVPNLVILDTAYVEENYAIAVNKDNDALLEEINAAMAELKDEGVVDAVIAKYIEGIDHDLTFQADVAEDAPTLTMGTNAEFPPYEYREGGAIVGIDAEIAAAIADKLGRKLVIEDMEFGSIIMALTTGSIDMGMAGMTVTEDRLESVNFTDTYATGIQVVIVRGDSEITSVDDLFVEGSNWRVGVQQATTGDIYATEDIADAGFGTMERYSSGAFAVQALMAGQLDCVIIDNEPAKSFVEANN